MAFDVTVIIKLVVALCATVLTTIAFPLLKAEYGADKLAEALKWVEIAVGAAEQIFAVTEGEKKYAYVKEFLLDKGIYYDDEELKNAIENAVLELHTSIRGNLDVK